MGHKTQDTRHKNTNNKANPFVMFLFFTLLLFTLSGCASMPEGIKGFLGISTKVLEDNRPSAIVKTFNYDYFSGYTKALDILKQMNAYVYAKDIKRHLIAVYVSKEDTTPVGMFFKEIDAENIQIEVSSPSSYAKELIASKLFSSLEISKSLEETEAQVGE